MNFSKLSRALHPTKNEKMTKKMKNLMENFSEQVPLIIQV